LARNLINRSQTVADLCKGQADLGKLTVPDAKRAYESFGSEPDGVKGELVVAQWL